MRAIAPITAYQFRQASSAQATSADRSGGGLVPSTADASTNAGYSGIDSSARVIQHRALAERVQHSPRMIAQRQAQMGLHAKSNSVSASAGQVAQLAPEAIPATVSRAYSANGDGASNVVEAQVNAVSDGGTPSCSPAGWADVLGKAPRVKGAWVRFHLLNQYLGGSGARTDNLVPTTVGINHNAIWRQMEQEAQGVAAAGQWVWWRTQVTYHAANGGAGHGVGFPSNINVQSKKWTGAAWINLTAGAGNYDLAVTAPNFAGGQVRRYFHEITGSQWRDVIGVTNGSLVNALVANSATIKTVDDMSTKVFYNERYNFEGLEDQISEIDDAVLGNNPVLQILLEE
jgi:hypothetical protein